MKASAIIRIIAFSVAIILLSFILLSVIDYNYYFENGRLHSYEMAAPAPTEAARQVHQQDISTQVQNIEIEWGAGSISIHKSDSLDYIRISEAANDGSAPEMICRQSGQTLKIQYCEEPMKFSSFGIHGEVSKDLVIRVPKNWNCNNLEIDAAATDVNIQDLTIRELDFDGASGNLILDHCNITDLDIDTASGDVEFVGTLDNLDFDAASAKFFGEFYNSPRSLKMDSMSGDLELVLPEYTGFELNMETVSGSFDTDFTFGKHSDLYICGDGNCKISVSAMSSDVSILKGITAGKNCDH